MFWVGNLATGVQFLTIEYFFDSYKVNFGNLVNE